MHFEVNRGDRSECGFDVLQHVELRAFDVQLEQVDRPHARSTRRSRTASTMIAVRAIIGGRRDDRSSQRSRVACVAEKCQPIASAPDGRFDHFDVGRPVVREIATKQRRNERIRFKGGDARIRVSAFEVQRR